MTKGLFITATGTDVGKTYVTALVVKKLREAGYAAGYYKAALSGAEPAATGLVPGDAAYVCRIADIPENPSDVVSYIYQTAVSPHLAAQLEGNPPDLEQIARDYRQLGERYDYLTVEGSGGVVCPLRYDGQQLMLTDVIKRLGLPALIVANAKLGSINAVVLTVQYLRQLHIPICGIVLNQYQAEDPMEVDNKKMMTALTGVPVLATLAQGDEALAIDADQLAALYVAEKGAK